MHLKKYWKTYLGIGILSILLATFGGYQLWNQHHVQAHSETLSTAQIKANVGSKLVKTRQNQQASATKKYQTLALSDDYSLTNPYVKVNPYGTSPLSALVIFQTKTAVKVQVKVVGHSKATTITGSAEKTYRKRHSISVLGLYAGTNNQVEITATDKAGHQTTKTIRIKTAELPAAVKSLNLKVTKSDTTKMDIGKNKLTFLVRSTKSPVGVDAEGQIRWYSTSYVQHVFKKLKNGHLLYLTKPNNADLVYNDLVETDYTGRIYKEYRFSTETKNNESASKKEETTVIHHDALELPNHNYLLTVSDGSGKYVEDTMVELSRKTGKIVRVIDLKKLLPASFYKNYNSTTRSDGKIDWFHQNSIDYDESDDSIVISSRHQDLVMKLDYQTLNFKWIFCSRPASKWPKSYRKYLLTTADSQTHFTGGQHAATIWSTSKANQKQLVLFNNNVAVTNGDKKTSKKYSEGASYVIDEKAMTVKSTWRYGESLGTTNFSNVIGSTRKLSNQNYLIDFGYNNDGKTSHIVEVDPTTNQPVYQLTFTNFGDTGYAYRAERWALEMTN
jgi:arylsulfate sulfotransferase